MKIDTNMATIQGVSKRPSSRFYQLCIVIPQDLQPAYEGRKTIRQSLRTADLREANLRGTQELANRLDEFNTKRLTLSPQRLDTVTPEMASELAQRVRATVLALDEAKRDDPSIRDALRDIYDAATRSPLEALTIRSHLPKGPEEPRDALSGLSAGEAFALAELNDIQNNAAGVQLAQRNLQAILPLVKEEACKLGLTFNPQAPGAREALQAALKAYRQAWQEVRLRDEGEIVDTPVVHQPKKSAVKPMKLRDVYERWKASKPRSPDSVNTCLRSIALYEQFTGNPPIDQLTREQGDGFRTWLQHPDRKTSSKTG